MITTTIGKQLLRFETAKPAAVAVLAIVWAITNVIPAAAQPPTTATVVYGQGGSFTSVAPNKGGIGANSLNGPLGGAFDSSGNLYVADSYNNRVLFYPAGSTTATRVYGQGGSFTSYTQNNGGVSANSLDYPYGVALDSSGNLYVADNRNSRVLFYPAGSTTATQVYGTCRTFTGYNCNATSADSLRAPAEVALDSNGNLYVADPYDNRVLFYPAGSTTATWVYGQGGSFTSYSCIYIDGGISADTLCGPFGVALDSNGNLYVADTADSRVLFYPAGSTTATEVYGQYGNFTTAGCDDAYSHVSANSLCAPVGVVLDSSGTLFVADRTDSRALNYGAKNVGHSHTGVVNVWHHCCGRNQRREERDTQEHGRRDAEC